MRSACFLARSRRAPRDALACRKPLRLGYRGSFIVEEFFYQLKSAMFPFKLITDQADRALIAGHPANAQEPRPEYLQCRHHAPILMVQDVAVKHDMAYDLGIGKGY